MPIRDKQLPATDEPMATPFDKYSSFNIVYLWIL